MQENNTHTIPLSSGKTNTVHHHHHHCGPILTPYVPIFYGSPYRNDYGTTIINNYGSTTSTIIDTKSKKEKEEENIQSTAGGIAIIGIAATVGTYLVANDEYTNYTNSEIEQEISSLKSLSLKHGDQQIICNVIALESTFIEWSNMFTNRTYTKRNTKITGTLSVAAIGGGLFFGSLTCMTGGALGIVASTCYYTWDHYTKCKKITKEKELFHNLFDDINNTQAIIAQLYYGVPEPSLTNDSNNTQYANLSIPINNLPGNIPVIYQSVPYQQPDLTFPTLNLNINPVNGQTLL